MEIKLIKGQEYDVQHYPSKVTSGTEYIGNKKMTIGTGCFFLHVFKFKENNEKRYIFMDEHWIDEEDGVITYNINSSTPVRILSKDIPDPKANVKTERSKLLEILKNLGEEI